MNRSNSPLMHSSTPVIRFIDPITGEGAPGRKPQYDPLKPEDYSNIPNEPGVYIWGVKVRVGAKDYFAPWCVGETARQGLQTRLCKGHYRKLCSSGNYNEELFDFSPTTYSAQDLIDLYASMKQYDDTVNHPPSGIPKLQNAVLVDKLIFWQNKRFFYTKCGIPFPHGTGEQNWKHREVVATGGRLDNFKTAKAALLKDKIIACKRNFDHGFYFIYSQLEPGLSLKEVEGATKQALRQIGLYTTAKGQKRYPGLQVNLPITTPFVHDLWGPGMSVRTLIEGPCP